MAKTEGYKEFVKSMDEAHDIAEQSEIVKEDSRKGVIEKAKEKLRKKIYGFMRSHGLIKEEDRIKSHKDLNDEYVGKYIGMVQNAALQDASRPLTNNLEEIVANIPATGLVALAANEEVQKVAGEKHAKISELASKSYRTVTGQLNKEDQKEIDKYIVMAAADEARVAVKDYDSNLQNAAADARLELIREGAVDAAPYEKKGLERMTHNIREELVKYMTKTGGTLKSYVGTALQKLTEGKTKTFNIARELVYGASKMPENPVLAKIVKESARDGYRVAA